MPAAPRGPSGVSKFLRARSRQDALGSSALRRERQQHPRCSRSSPRRSGNQRSLLACAALRVGCARS